LVGTASQYDRVPWAIFRQDERTPICSTIPVHLTVGEKTYANSLFNQTDSIRVQFGSKEVQVTNDDVPNPTMNKPTRLAHFARFRLIKDIEPRQWVDLTVNVVKTFPERSYFKIEVTDYTTNEALFDYFPESEDERMDGASDGYGHRSRVARRWRRPRGKMTLTIALWEPHGSWAHANISEGDMVFLKNVHIKSFNGFLEAAMHSDRTYPDKVNVIKLSHLSNELQLVDLLRRQQEYYKQFRADQESAKRTLSDTLNGDQRTKGKPDDKKGSKGFKKQIEKQKPKTIEEDQTEIATTLMTTQTGINNQGIYSLS
jgi:protection of telomeres protein 1